MEFCILYLGGKLCNMDVEALKKWNGHQYLDSMDAEIAPQGEIDALNLARRLKHTFPDFLRASSEKYDVNDESEFQISIFEPNFYQNSQTFAVPFSQKC